MKHINPLIPNNPRILIQGITGKEGTRALQAMQMYGTTIAAGVTPGKSGSTILGIPVYNSIAEAVDAHGPFDAVVQFVPPLAVRAATTEALRAHIPLILVGAEKVPIHDAIAIYHDAQKSGTVLIGPGSVGMIVPRTRLKIGMIGGNNPERAFSTGDIAILSKSGGMTSEIGIALKRNGLGVSFACGVGGERIVGSEFADLLVRLEEDEHTKASVLFGEIGGYAEEHVAKKIADGEITKPVLAITVGAFVAELSHEVPFGHTGAIMESGRGGVAEKREILCNAGVHVVERFDDLIPALLSLRKNTLS